MSARRTPSRPIDAEAPARILAGGAIALTTLAFVTVAASFDAKAGQHVIVAQSASALAAFERMPTPDHIATATASAAEPASPGPVIPEPAVSGPDARPGPDPKSKPRAAVRTAKRRQAAQPSPSKPAKLRPASAEDTTTVTRAIEARMSALGRCYERALLRAPGLAGKMSIRVEVSIDGRVTSARVRRNTSGDAWLSGCVEQRITGWRFPHLQGGSPVRVTIPVTFAR